MGRKATPNSGTATIDKLYPNVDPLTRKRLIDKLKTYASQKYLKKGSFPKGMIQFEQAEANSSKTSGVFYPKDSLTYVKNLLELDELTGKNETAIAILTKRDEHAIRDHRKFLTNRFRELQYRGEQYLKYAMNAEAITESLLAKKDPTKENLFKLPQQSDPIAQTKELKDSINDISFMGLSALRRMEMIERNDNLPEPELCAHKSVLYFQEGSTELALKYASESLKKDTKNGLAWMILGYLALKGGEEAQKVEIAHKELGAHINAISAEEQWHQELLEDARDCRELHLNRACEYFLKSWCYLPNTKICRLHEIYDLKPNMIVALFTHARIHLLDKQTLKKAVKNNLDDLQLLRFKHTTLFLTRALPIIHSADIGYAKNIASDFVKCVRNSKPWRIGVDPTDPTMDDYLIAAGENLMHLQNLSPTLPFEEVEAFMKEVDNRFKEVCRISRLKNHSEFYRKIILKSEHDESIRVCEAALHSIPFNRTRSYDKRLQKQWKYLYFSIPVHAALIVMLQKGTDTPEKVASLISGSITPDLMDAVIGEDYFDKKEEWDEFRQDSDHPVDLRGYQHHVMHYGIGLVKSDIISPFKEEYQATNDIPDNLSVFKFVLNFALKAKGINPEQKAKLEALHKRWKKFSPAFLETNFGIKVITPGNFCE